MATTRAIVFDVYQTLLEIKTDEEAIEPYEFLSKWLSYHGVRIDASNLRLRYLDLCSREISRSAERYPDFDIRTVFAQILLESREQDFDLTAKSGELALLFRILTTRSISVFPGVIELLDSLRGKAILGIVSNAQRSFTIPELAKFNLTGYFDAMALSSDVGVRKPDPKIFHTLLDAIAVPPEAALFIGDNIVDDVYGASMIGMKTIWIKRDGTCYDPSLPGSARPDYEMDGGSYDTLSHLLLSMLDK